MAWVWRCMFALAWLSRSSPDTSVTAVKSWWRRLQVATSQMNLYLFIVYRSLVTNDRLFDFILGVMVRIQSEDPKFTSCFVRDFNWHHDDWLGYNRTDSHGAAAFDLATLTDCTQMVRGPTHRASCVMDLVLTNVPE